jgi:hypothetical protein
MSYAITVPRYGPMFSPSAFAAFPYFDPSYQLHQHVGKKTAISGKMKGMIIKNTIEIRRRYIGKLWPKSGMNLKLKKKIVSVILLI